jgi:hypothetical protein
MCLPASPPHANSQGETLSIPRSQGTRDHHLASRKYKITIAPNHLKNCSQIGRDIVDLDIKIYMRQLQNQLYGGLLEGVTL